MSLASLSLFLTLLVLARMGYALGNVLSGRLARVGSSIEVATWRGLLLGAMMAPFAFFIPRAAWAALPAQSHHLVLASLAGSVAGICGLRAVRLLPFGLYAVVRNASEILGGVLLGIVVFGEHLSGPTLFCWALLALAASAFSLGAHSVEGLPVHFWRGLALALVGTGCIVFCVMHLTALARATHPLLAGWLWEFTEGIFCIPWLLLNRKNARAHPDPLPRRLRKIAAAASPFVLADGACLVALSFGPVSIASASCGLQIIFIALLGAAWHREKIGPGRWALIVLAAAAIAGIGLTLGAHSGN